MLLLAFGARLRFGAKPDIAALARSRIDTRSCNASPARVLD
jgi:hypothetical protein